MLLSASRARVRMLGVVITPQPRVAELFPRLLDSDECSRRVAAGAVWVQLLRLVEVGAPQLLDCGVGRDAEQLIRVGPVAPASGGRHGRGQQVGVIR